jgi:hypothetical protein
MSIHKFGIKFSNRKNNKCVSLIGYLNETGWDFGQYGTFRSEYESKYFNSTAEFMSALEKYLGNPSVMIYSVQVDGNLPTKFQYWNAEGTQQARQAVAELIAKVN